MICEICGEVITKQEIESREYAVGLNGESYAHKACLDEFWADPVEDWHHEAEEYDYE